MPQATITAMLRRSVAENPYILVTSIDSSGILTWEPTAHDTGIEGDGQIEIRAVENDVLAKSVTAIVCVERSLTPPEPDTPIDWVEGIKSDIAQSVTSAANSASDAAKSAASAQESAAAAAGSANAAQSSANAAAGSASAAGKSASDAAGSATEAAGSKDAAAQSATDAAQAAEAAAGSASAAQSSANAAAGSASAAGKSASDAAGSATEAAGSKDAAAQSASAAAASAEAAEKAAQDAAGIIDDTVIAEDSTWSSKQITDQNYTHFTVSGNPAVCEDVLEGYPLELNASWEPKQEGSGTPSPDNVRPITGKNVINVQKSGANMLNPDKINKNVINVYDLTIEYIGANTVRIKGPYNQNGARSFRILRTNYQILGGHGLKIIETVTGGTYLAHRLYGLSSGDKTSIALITDVKDWKPGTAVDMTIKIGVYAPEAALAEYQPYNGQNLSLTLQRTIYGGKIDPATGKGQETWGYIDSYAGETLPGEWISDRDEYAAGATPTLGAQVAYKLVTPVPFTATGGQTALALAGTNAIITDADALTVGGVKSLHKPIDDTRVGTDNVWSSKNAVDKLLPMQTVTGNPAVIETLEGYPMSVKASWGPKQEGEGEPYPAGGSKNLLSLDAWVDKTVYGITFKREGNGIHVSGTATGNATSDTISMQNLEPGNYYGWKSIEGLTQQLVTKPAAGNTNLWQEIDDKKYATINEGDEGKYWCLNIATGTTFDYIIYPQIYKSDTAPTRFWPYSNIRPIKGRESVKITANGTEHTLALPDTIYGGEVDAVTGKGIKAIGYIRFTGTETWSKRLSGTTESYAATVATNAPAVPNLPATSSHFEWQVYAYAENESEGKFAFESNGVTIRFCATQTYKNEDEWAAYLAAQYAAGTPVQVVYKLATPETLAATGGGRIDALAGTNTILTDADTVIITAPTPPQTTASAAEAQAAKLDYVAMMADVDVDDLTAVDDADADTGVDMDMPTGIEGSEMDGKQEV